MATRVREKGRERKLIMLYTSYFAKMKNLPDTIVPIAICGKAPVWYQGLQYKKLAPRYDFFMKWKQDHNNEEFSNCYQSQVLAHLNASDVLTDLKTLARSDKDIVMLCFEKPTDFCHRHLVAEWFKQHGIACEEYKY